MLLSKRIFSGHPPLKASKHIRCASVAPVGKQAVRQALVRAAASDSIAEDDKTKLEQLLAKFKQADADGNGQIDRQELRSLLDGADGNGLLSKHWLSDEELDRVMAIYDKDGNGTIDSKEFMDLVYDGLLLDGKLTEYKNAFDAADASGNGSLGATELAQLFASLGQPVSLEKLVDIMQEYDKDESGQIEFSEFIMMFRNRMLDLGSVTSYMLTAPSSPGRKGEQPALLQVEDGDLILIFSETELTEVFARHPDKVVLVFAALTWCRPCKAMQRPAMKLAEHYKEGLVTVKLFGNANSRTKQLFKTLLKVRSTPSFLFFKDGKMVQSMTGASKDKLETAIRSIAPADKLPAERLYPAVTA